VAVIIISAELDEIYALADQIAVMYEGRITGFRPPTVPVGELGLLMAGAGQDAAAAAGETATGPVHDGLAPAGTGIVGTAIPSAASESAVTPTTEAEEPIDPGDVGAGPGEPPHPSDEESR
jgi:hypothetical protein